MKLRELLGWALLPALLVMQFFDLRRGLVGSDWTWSAYLVGYALIVIIGLPLVWRGLRELPKPVWVGMAAFTAILAYATVSALVSGPPVFTTPTTAQATPPDTWTYAPMRYRLVPLLTAWLTMAAGLIAVIIIPAARRLSRLWWAGWLLVLTSLLAWPRAMLVNDSPRLATGIGGSATIHLVFLLCTGLFLGAAWQGHRVRWSVAGGAVSVLCLLFTGSRAGALSLAVLAVMVVVWLGQRIRARITGLALAALVVVGTVVVAVVPAARRLLVFGDEMRMTNFQTAWPQVTENWLRVLFGIGSGRLWPWYAFDARFLRVPHRGRVGTSEGFILTNPHSVPLGVVVELGLVGLALLLVLCGVLLVRLWRGWRSPAGIGGVPEGLLLALVAGFVAFAFDYYLFKNFGVSFWWWVCYVMVFTVSPRRQPDETAAAEASAMGA